MNSKIKSDTPEVITSGWLQSQCVYKDIVQAFNRDFNGKMKINKENIKILCDQYYFLDILSVILNKKDYYDFMHDELVFRYHKDSYNNLMNMKIAEKRIIFRDILYKNIEDSISKYREQVTKLLIEMLEL